MADEPPAARNRLCREDGRCDAPGRERHRGQRGGQNHRRDRGHATNSAKTRDADRRGSAAALGLLPRDQDQPHRGGQDEDRALDRHQRPWHGPGHVPRLSQPSQPGHRAEEVLCLTALRLAIPLTCRYRARPGSLPALLLPRTACWGTVGRPPTARAHRSSDCGSSTGRRARPSHLTDSRVCWLGHDRSGADPGEDPARTDASWRPPTPKGS